MTFGANAGALAPFSTKGGENAFHMGVLFAGLQNQLAAHEARAHEDREASRQQMAMMQAHMDNVMGEPTTHTALFANTQHT